MRNKATHIKCGCGKKTRLAPYVYAHWYEELTFTCECKEVHEFCCGKVTSGSGELVREGGDE